MAKSTFGNSLAEDWAWPESLESVRTLCTPRFVPTIDVSFDKEKVLRIPAFPFDN